MKEARLMYDSFLEGGDLKTFLPKATGEWERDEKIFMEYYREQQEILKNIGVNEDNTL